MQTWIKNYLVAQQAALAALDPSALAPLITCLRDAHASGRRIFAIGNGGSAANASHFATDLGKGASDLMGDRFKVLSLTDNTAWITALGNDYHYDDVFRRQLENFAEPGDVLLVMSVSGNSPNLVQSVEWANEQGVTTLALLGQGGGRLADIARHVIRVQDTHYGRVEDTHMTICHLLCYAFMELPEMR